MTDARMDSDEAPRVFIVLDAVDVERIASFWAEALRYHRVDRLEQYVVLVPREGDSAAVFLVQGVAETKHTKNPERRLGWREIASLRLPDRLTISVGGSSYINVRERADSLENCGYEHFGVLLPSAGALRRLWDELAHEVADVDLEPLSPNDHGEARSASGTSSRWRWRRSTTPRCRRRSRRRQSQLDGVPV
jgi:hypothetical protein